MDSLKELQAVRRAVVEATREENVNVHLGNERYLTISLINSPLKALPEDQKKAKAREIADVAYKAFPSRAQLESVAVVYLVHKTYFFFFNYSDGTDVARFVASDLAPREAPTPSQEVK